MNFHELSCQLLLLFPQQRNQRSLECIWCVPLVPARLRKHHLSCSNDTFSSKVFIHSDIWHDKEIVSSLRSPHLSAFSLPKPFGIPVGNDQNITNMFITEGWETAVKAARGAVGARKDGERMEGERCSKCSVWNNTVLEPFCSLAHSKGNTRAQCSRWR